jgi:3-methyladenine DNA glycosylase Mpg
VSISVGELIAESMLDRDFYARPAVQVARDCLGEMLLQEKPA